MFITISQSKILLRHPARTIRIVMICCSIFFAEQVAGRQYTADILNNSGHQLFSFGIPPTIVNYPFAFPLAPYPGYYSHAEYGKIDWQGHPPDRGIDGERKYFQAVVNYYTKTGDYINLATAWKEWASNTENKQEQISYYWNACRVYRLMRDLPNYTACLKEIANLHLLEGKFKEAENELLSIIDIQKRYDSDVILYSYDLLAAVYEKEKIYDRALDCALKSIESARRFKKYTDLRPFYVRAMGVYASIGNRKKVLEYGLRTYNANYTGTSRKAAKDYSEYYNYFTLMFVNKYYYLAGNSKAALQLIRESEKLHPAITLPGKHYYHYALGDYYGFIHDFKKAEQHYLIARNLADMVGGVNGHLQIDLDLCQIYASEKNFIQVNGYVKDFFKSLIPTYTPVGLAKAYHFKYQVDSAFGNWKSAARSYKLQDSISSILLNEKQLSHLSELEIRHRAMERQNEINVLQGTEKVRANLIAASDRSRYFTYAIIALLLVISLLLFYNDHIKRTTNVLLKSQKSEIDEQNIMLKTEVVEKENLLREREYLFEELHHRVKSNLEIIESLLNIHRGYLEDEDAIGAIMDTRHRINSIALIHRKLYQSEGSARVDMKTFIEELTRYLAGSISGGKEIAFKLSLEAIIIEVSYAVPLGIIINEVVTNSIKYAFSGKENGSISISLSQPIQGEIALDLSDNGQGTAQDVHLWESDTMGMTLIQTFCEQIEAACSIENKRGIHYAIRFGYPNG